MAKTLSQSEPGEKFITPSKIITQSEAELFCVTTGNTLGIFLSDEAARAKGWDRRITPGALTFSITIGLIVAAGILDDGLAFLGTDELRFLAPVHIGDTLQVEVELLEKSLTKVGERGTLRYKWQTLNQSGKEVARGINSCLIKVGFLENQKR